jgi:hypothetical protein
MPLCQITGGQLEDMVNDRGGMTLSTHDKGMAVYELSYDGGTKLYPVVFSLSEDGVWKISKF